MSSFMLTYHVITAIVNFESNTGRKPDLLIMSETLKQKLLTETASSLTETPEHGPQFAGIPVWVIEAEGLQLICGERTLFDAK